MEGMFSKTARNRNNIQAGTSQINEMGPHMEKIVRRAMMLPEAVRIEARVKAKKNIKTIMETSNNNPPIPFSLQKNRFYL
jgi:hypothetical protein